MAASERTHYPPAVLPGPFSPVRSVSVLMPTWQGEEFLDRVLGSLAEQELELPWDFTAIDSGSTDRTLAIFDEWRERFPVPLSVRGIDQVEFDHGDTRNLLAAWSEGELLVFLTQDAIPKGSDWLARLVADFDDPQVAAAYCRNVPRPDARPLTQVGSAQDPGYAAGRREVTLPPDEEYEKLSPHEKRLLYNFNDVASAVRRAAWELHPFPRTWFGEDVLMARALLEAGWTVVYDDEATVEHSHDYTPDEVRSRAKIDGRFNAEWLDRICVGSKSDARTLTERLSKEDLEALRAAGHTVTGELEREVRELRKAAFEGLYEGGLSELRREPTGVLEKKQLKLLYVLHGFPPDTWAGTEIYTLNLAQEMQRLGHECVVLARVPAEGEGAPEDFHVEESEFEGLRVLRMTHRLEHRSLRESYHQPRAEEAFRSVLLSEAPDLVHFQHLIHLSAGLVALAKELGLPTVVHCHDYWALCARVQLIRPDGERCPSNMGAGCLLCVKEQHLDKIPRVKRLGELGGTLLDALATGGRRIGSERSRRRWEGYEDMRDRHGFVVGAYAAADLRISPSRYLRQLYLETGRFDAHSFLYSDNGMRTDHVEALEKRPDPRGRVRFGFVGSLVWYKGGEVLVRAMAELVARRGPDVAAEVSFHGGFDPAADEHHAELQQLAADLGDHVTFAGRFDNSRLSEVYAGIDVLVVPSTWYENSPITIHEAFLTRTPVLASDIGGMAEYVRDGVDGLTFRVGDAGSLADAMERFLDEPALLEELGADPLPIKTIAENARETEFRYRALVSRKRARRARTLLDVVGIDTLSRMGPAEQQGADLLLLRPGGAAAEYDLSALPTGIPVEVRVDCFALAAERRLKLGGRVLLGERELGRIEPFAADPSGEAEQTVSFSWTSVLRPGDRLRVEGRLGGDGPDSTLRVARVLVRDPGEDATREVVA